MSFPNSNDEPARLEMITGVFALAITLAFLSINPLELAFALVLLYAIIASAWRVNTPAVAVALLIIPWLEISAIFVEANLTGTSIYDLLDDHTRKVYWSCAIGLTIVSFGFWSGYKKTIVNTEAQVFNPRVISIQKLVVATIILNVIVNGVGTFIGRGSSLYQINTYLSDISYILLVAASIEYFQNRRSHIWFWGLFLVSFIFSFYSFFSEWKNILFCLLIGVSQVKDQINRRFVVPVFFVLIIGASFIQLWQAIKPAYRMYLSNSSRIGQLDSQRVVRTQGEAIAKFIELSKEYYQRDEEKNDENDFATLRRIGYLEYFAVVANRIPNELPHERGQLLMANATFAFIPRFINPDKGVKNDRAKVEKYTGLILGKTSSFSLGHYTEYFIDFGFGGMLIILFIFGRVGGWIYHTIFTRYAGRLGQGLTFGILFVVLRQWGTIQNDSIFLFGYVTWSLIVHGFLLSGGYDRLHAFISEDPEAAAND